MRLIAEAVIGYKDNILRFNYKRTMRVTELILSQPVPLPNFQMDTLRLATHD